MARVTEAEIEPVLERALEVSRVDARAALLICWATLEALGRERKPDEFAGPQSPASIIERLASKAIITPAHAAFLRTMAEKRNAFVHGDLRQTVRPADVLAFVALVRELTASPGFRSERSENGEGHAPD